MLVSRVVRGGAARLRARSELALLPAQAVALGVRALEAAGRAVLSPDGSYVAQGRPDGSGSASSQFGFLLLLEADARRVILSALRAAVRSTFVSGPTRGRAASRVVPSTGPALVIRLYRGPIETFVRKVRPPATSRALGVG